MIDRRGVTRGGLLPDKNDSGSLPPNRAGQDHGQPNGMQALGILAAARGQTKQAVVIFGALDRWFGWLKNVSSPAVCNDYEQALESIQTELGSESFQSAWNEGEAMSPEQAMVFVSEGLDLQ